MYECVSHKTRSWFRARNIQTWCFPPPEMLGGNISGEKSSRTAWFIHSLVSSYEMWPRRTCLCCLAGYYQVSRSGRCRASRNSQEWQLWSPTPHLHYRNNFHRVQQLFEINKRLKAIEISNAVGISYSSTSTFPQMSYC